MSADSSAQSFNAIYVQEFPFVWRSLRCLGVRDGELDDAAQEVFVTVHRRLSTFRGDSAIRTWLFGIVRNVAFKHRRRLARKPTTGQAPPTEAPQPGPGPLERAQDREAAAFVQRFLGRLNDKKRDIFILAVMEEMNITEVAAALSIPLNTAYTRMRSVRADFQKALARRMGAEPRLPTEPESHR